MAKDDDGGKGSKRSGGKGKGSPGKSSPGKGADAQDPHGKDSNKAAAKKARSGAGSSARATRPSVDAASPTPTTSVDRPAHRDVTAPPPVTPPSVSAASTTPTTDPAAAHPAAGDPPAGDPPAATPAVGAARTNGTSGPDTGGDATNGTGPRANGTGVRGADTTSTAPTPVTSLSSAAAALRSPSTTGARATVAGRPGPSTEVAVPAGRAGDDITRTLVLPLQIARNVLPAGRTPVYLGAAALALVGIVEWPAALGLGLAWEALRRWGPRAESDR